MRQHRLQKHVEVVDNIALMLTGCADDSLHIALLPTYFDLEKKDYQYYDQIAKNQSPVGVNKKPPANINLSCETAHLHSGIRIPYEMELRSDEPKENYD